MTDLNSLILPRINTEKVELNTASLGKVLVGHLSVSAMLKVSKLIEQEVSITDSQIARSLFKEVVQILTGKEGQITRPVNSDELENVTDADLEIFAETFNKQQGWISDQGDVSDTDSQVQLLCKKLHDELSHFSETVNKSFKLPKDLFSNDTQKLISASALIGERLKDFAGTSSLAKQLEFSNSSARKAMESINKASTIASASKLFEDQMRLTSAAREIAAQAEAMKAINQSVYPSENHILSVPKLQDFSESMQRASENSPMARSAKTLTALDSKVDEVLEIAQTVAELHGKTNEAILSGLSNLADKWNKDERNASTTLKWAVRGIFISALFALVAVTQDFVTNRGNEKQQQEAKAMLEEQLRLSKDMAKEQVGRNVDIGNKIKKLETELALAKKTLSQLNRANKSISETK